MSASPRSPPVLPQDVLQRLQQRRASQIERAAQFGRARRAAYEAARQSGELRKKPSDVANAVAAPKSARLAAPRRAAQTEAALQEFDAVQVAIALSLSESSPVIDAAAAAAPAAVDSEPTGAPTVALRSPAWSSQTLDARPPRFVAESSHHHRLPSWAMAPAAHQLTDFSYESLLLLEDVPLPLAPFLLECLPRGPYVPPPTIAKKLRSFEDDGVSCPICLDVLAAGEDVATLPSCGHQFHWDCIQPWFARKKTCCLCKREVTV